MTLDDHLDSLELSGLIRLAQLEPDIEYLFRHAMVQQAAYDSLLRQDRRLLHRAVGEVLEAEYAGHPELAATLARHFDAAGEPARAFGYYVTAGDQSMSQYANAEASILFAHALALATDPVDSDALKDVYLKRGRALEYQGSYAEALANYEAMEAAAHQRGDGGMEIESMVRRASIYGMPSNEHNSQQARSLLGRALELAEAIDDQAAQASIHWSLIITEKFAGNTPAAQAHGEKALKLAQGLGDEQLLAYVLNDLATHVYLDLGRHRDGLASALAAEPLWRRLDHQPMLADSLSTAANLAYLMGNFEEANTYAQEACSISVAIDNLWGQSYSRWVTGEFLAEQGRMAEAIDNMITCIELGERAKFLVPLIDVGMNLAHVYMCMGDLDTASVWAQKALARSEAEFPSWRRGALAFLARLAVRRGDHAQAVTLLEDMYGGSVAFAPDLYVNQIHPCLAAAEISFAERKPAQAAAALDDLLAYMQRTETRAYRPDALLLRGRASQRTGDWEAARAWFAEARTEAESLGSQRMLWRALAALAVCEDHAGSEEAAHSLRAEAREIVAFIAAHCPDDLRASFQALPEVASLAL